MARRRSKKSSRRFVAVFWSLAAFFSLGYFPTMMAHDPVISMTAAACLIIPYGARSATLKRAIIRGLVLGFVAGSGIWSALLGGGQLSQEYAGTGYLYIGATVFMCVVVSALFSHMARKRRRELEKAWDELD